MAIKIKSKKIVLILALVAFIFGAAFSAIFRLGAGLPSPEEIKNYHPPVSTKIYDCQQRLVYEFFQQKRTPVSLHEIPQMLKDALITVEDKRFYSHWGVDIIRIFGALFYNLKTMRKAQGASTITQQLARNMFLTQEKTFVRKLKELLLAFELERTYSKDEILEMYLNQVWFGAGAYGVEAASQVYFNKSVKDLTLPECALLAALPKAPQYYSPYVNPAQALKRRNLFLKMLYKAKKITKVELENALASPLGVVPKKSLKNSAPYFVEEIRKYLIDRYGEDFIYRSGAKIYTTLDLDIQNVANQVIEKHLSQIEREYRLAFTKSKFDSIARFDSLISPNYLQGALVAIDPKTGYIKAMVGGRDFAASQFNRAIQAKRQAGSAFKPFVYAVAIDQGFTPANLEADAEIVLNIPGVRESYRPRNFDNRFMGLMTLRRALALSRNVVAVRIISKVSPENVVRYASAMGISSRLQPVYSLALGACEVTLLDITKAFAVFANDGYKIKPIFILKIVDADNTVIEDNSIQTEPVLDSKVAYIITNMLESVVNEGTAYVIRRLGFNYPAAGKTGTTDDYTDCWFIGYTPDLVCGIWVGYDTKKTIFHGATGGGVAAPIWADFMNGIVQFLSGSDFKMPDSIVKVKVCDLTGFLATGRCPKTRDEVFVLGTEPTEECQYHKLGIPFHESLSPDIRENEGF